MIRVIVQLLLLFIQVIGQINDHDNTGGIHQYGDVEEYEEPSEFSNLLIKKQQPESLKAKNQVVAESEVNKPKKVVVTMSPEQKRQEQLKEKEKQKIDQMIDNAMKVNLSYSEKQQLRKLLANQNLESIPIDKIELARTQFKKENHNNFVFKKKQQLYDLFRKMNLTAQLESQYYKSYFDGILFNKLTKAKSMENLPYLDDLVAQQIQKHATIDFTFQDKLKDLEQYIQEETEDMDFEELKDLEIRQNADQFDRNKIKMYNLLSEYEQNKYELEKTIGSIKQTFKTQNLEPFKKSFDEMNDKILNMAIKVNKKNFQQLLENM